MSLDLWIWFDFSIGFLVVINLLVWFEYFRASVLLWLVFTIIFAIPSALIFNNAYLFQAILVGICLVFRRSLRLSAKSFLKMTVALTGVAYAITLGICSLDLHHLGELRRLFPYESMTSRLSGRRPIPSPTPRPADLLRNEESLSYRTESALEWGEKFSRDVELWRLHEHKLGLFLNSAGFGNERFLPFPTRVRLEMGSHRGPVPPLPESPPQSDWSLSQRVPTRKDDRESLFDFLARSTANFANPQGFGEFKDREHVAGFMPHQFRSLPEPKSRWEARRVELVSLLMHESPVVYVTETLPSMANFRKHPTRPLNTFESRALSELIAGKDLEIDQDSQSMQMLGAIRASESCTDCHDARIDDLLGAFSYRLRLVTSKKAR